jgi:hypothetical protein
VVYYLLRQEKLSQGEGLLRSVIHPNGCWKKLWPVKLENDFASSPVIWMISIPSEERSSIWRMTQSIVLCGRPFHGQLPEILV